MDANTFTPLQRITWGVARHFKTESAAEQASRIRSALIERLDELWASRLQSLFDEFGLEEGQSLQLMQAIQLALFPEEFLEEDEIAEGIKGLMPNSLARVSSEQLRAFADLLNGKATTP